MNYHISKRKCLKNIKIFITFWKKKESVREKKINKREKKNGDDLFVFYLIYCFFLMNLFFFNLFYENLKKFNIFKVNKLMKNVQILKNCLKNIDLEIRHLVLTDCPIQ